MVSKDIGAGRASNVSTGIPEAYPIYSMELDLDLLCTAAIPDLWKVHDFLCFVFCLDVVRLVLLDDRSCFCNLSWEVARKEHHVVLRSLSSSLELTHAVTT